VRWPPLIAPRRPCPRCGSTSRVCEEAGEGRRSIAAPKGRGPRTPAPVSLQTGCFLGGHEGGHDPIHGPPAGVPAGAAAELAAALLVGEGHALVVAVLLASASDARQPLEPICAPKGIGPAHPGYFPCKTATSEGAQSGAMGRSRPPAAAAGHACAPNWRGRVMPPLWQYLLPS
jgi:hypothetical protein